ncbi:MYG1 family protein [Candidatus Saccharibacteria bacterium]|nr:MYG1 family protein [Candidatus Saccharibacteria bacterium]
MIEFSSFDDATFVTHSGKFHADEVMATAILLELRDAYKHGLIKDEELGALAGKFSSDSFVLCRIPEIMGDMDTKGKFLYDIGGRDYDHHQLERNGKRDNGIYYSSVGLIWKEFGMLICKNVFPKSEDLTKRLWAAIDKKLVQVIDAGDNGQFPEIVNEMPIMNLDELIGEFNPVWKDSQTIESQNRCFIKAVDFAGGIFDRMMICETAKISAISTVESAINKSEDGVLILPKYLPWEEYVISSDNPKARKIMLAVFPSNRDEGCYVVMSPRDESGKSRMLMPANWRGKRNEELDDFVEGGTFCHANGFMAVADSFEHAVSMAHAAISDPGSEMLAS